MKHTNIASFLGSRDSACVVSVDGLHLGMDKESVVAFLGEPERTQRDWWFYEHASVRITHNAVEAISFPAERVASAVPLEAFDELLILTGAPDLQRGRAGNVTLYFTEREFSICIHLAPFKITCLTLGTSGAQPYRSDDSWLFADGFCATVEAVTMYLTYAGLLEGVPTDEMNAAHIDGLLNVAVREFGGWPVHLVRPVLKPVWGCGPRGSHDSREVLPSVACVGKFDSLDCVRQFTMDGSRLVVAWFQDRMTFPGDRDQFHLVPWRDLAQDYEC